MTNLEGPTEASLSASSSTNDMAPPQTAVLPPKSDGNNEEEKRTNPNIQSDKLDCNGESNQRTVADFSQLPDSLQCLVLAFLLVVADLREINTRTCRQSWQHRPLDEQHNNDHSDGDRDDDDYGAERYSDDIEDSSGHGDKRYNDSSEDNENHCNRSNEENNEFDAKEQSAGTEFSEDEETEGMRLLADAPIVIQDSKQDVQAACAAVDTGAGASFISKDTVELYGLKKRPLMQKDIIDITNPISHETCKPDTFVVVPLKSKKLGLDEFVSAKLRVLDGPGFDIILGRPFIGKHRILARLPKFDRAGKPLLILKGGRSEGRKSSSPLCKPID
jgi:hypothetical protein